MNHDQFIEGACFKRGGFYMKVIKRPDTVTYRTGIDEVFFGAIKQHFEVITIEFQKDPNPITKIQKHYLLSDWIDTPITTEEFNEKYKLALEIITNSLNSI